MVMRYYYTCLMHEYNCISGNLGTDFILGDITFLYYPTYIRLKGKIPAEVAKEICKTEFFGKSLSLSKDERKMCLDDCIITNRLHIGLAQYAQDAEVLNVSYEEYCSKYEQYRKELTNISKKKGEEFYIENLYFTSLPAIETTLKILEKYNLIPNSSISN